MYTQCATLGNILLAFLLFNVHAHPCVSRPRSGTKTARRNLMLFPARPVHSVPASRRIALDSAAHALGNSVRLLLACVCA
eukprot:2208810-Rhodomonas_salina.1